MKNTPLLHTDRLVLRPFSLEDSPEVYAWCSSWVTTQYLFWYPHRDIEVSKRLVSSWVRKKRNYSWALERDGKAVGEIQVIKDLPNHGFEIGYILREDYWHQGLMQEGVQAVLRFLFLEDGYEYGYEETDERNASSRRLLEKVGFVFKERKSDVFIAKKNETVALAVYTMTKSDYLKANP
jgi:ribosomal-protein-alanine N-acetyltransferase